MRRLFLRLLLCCPWFATAAEKPNFIPRGHQTTPHIFLENELPSCGADKIVRGTGKKGGAEANYSEPGRDHSQVSQRLLGAAEKFVDDVPAKNKASGNRAPFFMHFCTDGTHAPYKPAEQIRGTALKDQTKMVPHTDMVLETELLLGKLMVMLEQRGLLADTLICFTSENGGIPAERYLGHALYDLKADLAERQNLIADPAHAARVKAMEKTYREIRSSQRSTNTR